jgi:hypothetical protein
MYGHDFTFQHMDMAIHTQTKYEGEKRKNRKQNRKYRHKASMFPVSSKEALGDTQRLLQWNIMPYYVYTYIERKIVLYIKFEI